MTTRRDMLRQAGLGALAAQAGYILVPAAHGQTPTLRVKYDWLMSNGQLGDIVALKRNLFDEAGFKVEFIPGGPNSATVPPVTSGQALLGQFSSSTQAMNAVSAGLPIKIIATGFRSAPFAYFSLPAKPVRKPEDLIGKRIGTQPTARFATDAMIKKYKLDPTKLEIVNMGFDMTPLVAGQIDVATGWITNTKALSIIGPQRIDYLIKDAGVINYGNVYFASNDAIAKSPEPIAKFLAAVAKGWEWSFANRAAAVDIMCDAYETLERGVEQQTVDTIMKLSFDADTKANGWGWFDPKVIQESTDLFASVGYFQDKKVPAIADLMTTQFLDATAAVRAKLST